MSRMTRKGLATRERIIDYATDLMIDDGIANTSIDDIRHAAGVSGSQMAHYFADKHDLIGAVIDRAADRVMDGQQPYLDHFDSLEAIEAWADLEINYQRSAGCPGCPLGSLAAELLDVDPSLAARVRDHMDTWAARMSNGLRDMKDRGDLRKNADPDNLARALLTGLQGGLFMTNLTGDVAPVEAIMTRLIDDLRRQTNPTPSFG